MNSRQIIKQLEEDGWTLRGVKGNHHIFTHPNKPGQISVPHPKQVREPLIYSHMAATAAWRDEMRGVTRRQGLFSKGYSP